MSGRAGRQGHGPSIKAYFFGTGPLMHYFRAMILCMCFGFGPGDLPSEVVLKHVFIYYWPYILTASLYMKGMPRNFSPYISAVWGL